MIISDDEAATSKSQGSMKAISDIQTERSPSNFTDAVTMNPTQSRSINGGVPSSTDSLIKEDEPIARCIGWKQTMALLGKNMLTKYRTPLPTFFEIFSPVMMMLILVLAYSLAATTELNAEQYSSLAFDIPGPWFNLLARSLDFAGSSSDNVSAFDRVNRTRHFARLLMDINGTINTTQSGTSGDGVELLADAVVAIQDAFKDPLPVPTFSQYVQASLAMSNLFNADNIPGVFSDSSFGRQWGNLLTLGTLHLSPNTPIVAQFWTYLNETYPDLMEKSIRTRLHESEATALTFINSNLKERTWALLDFSNYQGVEDFQYKIRMNYTTLPNTNLIVDFASIGLNPRYKRYYLSGYLSLQRTLNEFAMSRNNCEQADTNLWSMPMPTAAYSQNSFFQSVGFLLGLTVAMAYMYPTSRTIKSMVEEKETRMKETLFILGVRPWAHWFSWVLTTGIIFFIISVLVTFTLSSNVLKYSSPTYLFVLIGLFSTATMGFCFVIASFFSRAKLASIVGPMALFATVLPRFIFFGSNRYEATTAKKWASLLPCTAFAFAADIIADYEYTEVGVQSFNAGEGEYSFDTALGFLFLDTFLYMFLGWYLELVIPRQYGVARPFYFIFLPSYWWSCMSCFVGRQSIRRGGKHSSGVTSTNTTVASLDLDREPVVHSDDIEPDDPSLVPRVCIHNLVKKYSMKRDVSPAVNNLNLNFYESQITCLLGHNGAGKTSVIGVLTGLFPPTSGDCLIYGNSVISDTSLARQSMGICPQHNVLFDRLTVIEHLAFFQKIKGLRPSKEDVREKALEVGLGEYFKTTSSALSGGNKRKLSLAIALCGDPRFLLLDEPTSGMDPASRRACWELLRRKRAGRVTLLTTHFLDEASLLADRIVILKEGNLQCCGSELFLKTRFGLGYNLTIVLNASNPLDGEPRDPYPPTTNEENYILAFFKDFIPGTELIRKSAREITFRFPQGLEGLFPNLFNALEEARERLGIGAYGISNTSLEEVFLQLAEKNSFSNTEKAGANRTTAIAAGEASPSHPVALKGAVPGTEDLDGHEVDPEPAVVTQDDLVPISALRQVSLLYMKRLVIQRRDLKGACFMIVLPVVLCGLVLLVLTLDIVLAGPAIDMSMSLYEPNSNGFSGPTDLVFGGGAAITEGNESQTTLSKLFANFSSSLQYEYPNTNLSHVLEAKSSSNISQYLLDTYNDRNHNPRYGAFAFRDTISLRLNVDWDGMRNSINNLTFREGGTINLSEFFAISDNLTFNITSSSVANSFLGLNLLSGNSSNDLKIQLQTETVLLDKSRLRLIFKNATLNSAIGVLVENEDIIVPLNSTNSLPSGFQTYYSDINSTASILHNSSSPHAVAAFNQAYMEFMFKQCSSDPKQARLVSVNHPLPLTNQQSIEIQTTLSVLASLFLLIPYCYIPGAFVVFLVKERVSKSKHLQLVSGVNLSSYWVSAYLWDLSLFLFLSVLIILVFLIYGNDSAVVFVGTIESLVATFALTFGYGLSSLPFAYLLSRSFDNHSSAQIAVMGIFFVTGFVAVNAYFIMSSIDSTKQIAEALQPYFRTWPAYNVGEGFINLSNAYWEREILGYSNGALDWDVAGMNLAIIYGLSIPYFLILLMLEYADDGGAGGFVGRALRKIRGSYESWSLRWHGIRKGDDGVSLLLNDGLDGSTGSEDEDVAVEREQVTSNADSLKESASVLLVNLWKVYPPSVGIFGSVLAAIRRGLTFLICCCFLSKQQETPQMETEDDKDLSFLPKRAVRGVTTAIPQGETFGLLGVNGAGKTTILGVLTGDITPTGGQAFVAGNDVTGITPGGVDQARKHIGFCPQVDPLLDGMTGRETLIMFGKLRGIPKEHLKAIVTDLIDKLTLTPHADKVSEAYSGGNKRKLSLGVALIGDPRVLFIDEASSGMDPAARRHMWELISKVSEKRSTILTSHSMEEAEALCTRVAIMVKGQMLCLGSVQHVKSKYLDGYTIDVHCIPGTLDAVVDGLVQEILHTCLPESILAERHGRFLRFEVSSLGRLGLGATFQRLQELKEQDQWCVENYSISQCSLEQVFIKLVKQGNSDATAVIREPVVTTAEDQV